MSADNQPYDKAPPTADTGTPQTGGNVQWARYVAAVEMADYLANALDRSLGVQREGQLGIAAAALARYQGWRSTLEAVTTQSGRYDLSPNDGSGT